MSVTTLTHVYNSGYLHRGKRRGGGNNMNTSLEFNRLNRTDLTISLNLTLFMLLREICVYSSTLINKYKPSSYCILHYILTIVHTSTPT